MIPYLFFFIFLILIAIIFKILKFSKKVFLLLFLFSVVLFQGFRRFDVGTDLETYLFVFLNSKNLSLINPPDFFNFEKGYIILNIILSNFNNSQLFFQLILALLIHIPVVYGVFKYSNYPLSSIFLYIGFYFFIYSFSALRQSLASSILLLSYNFILSRKFLPFLLFVFFATSIHYSAIFFLIAYPIKFIKIQVKFIPLIVFSLFLVHINSSSIYNFVKIFFLNDLPSIEITGSSSFFYFLLFILCSLSLKIGKTDDKFSLFLNFFIITIFIQSFSNVSFTIMRLSMPFFISIIFFLPNLADFFPFYLFKRPYLALLIVFGVLFFLYQTSDGFLDLIPYSLMW